MSVDVQIDMYVHEHAYPYDIFLQDTFSNIPKYKKYFFS